MKNLNGTTYSMEEAARHIWQTYPGSYDDMEAIRTVADHLNHLYQVGGEQEVDKFFRKTASDQYRHDFKALVMAL